MRARESDPTGVSCLCRLPGARAAVAERTGEGPCRGWCSADASRTLAGRCCQCARRAQSACRQHLYRHLIGRAPGSSRRPLQTKGQSCMRWRRARTGVASHRDFPAADEPSPPGISRSRSSTLTDYAPACCLCAGNVRPAARPTSAHLESPLECDRCSPDRMTL